ncbi:MAG TPA: type II/IV secretion system protein, partial [Pirellulaceae bacterium]|nr:type II/IV secretion system protein [Pirellulaceae bacterium]
MEAGEILIRRGLMNRSQLEQTRSMANGHGDGTRLIESAIQLGFVSEEQALKAVGEEVGIEFIDLSEAQVDLSLLKTFPQ